MYRPCSTSFLFFTLFLLTFDSYKNLLRPLKFSIPPLKFLCQIVYFVYPIPGNLNAPANYYAMRSHANLALYQLAPSLDATHYVTLCIYTRSRYIALYQIVGDKLGSWRRDFKTNERFLYTCQSGPSITDAGSRVYARRPETLARL